jgi:hypothetical protein
MIPKEAEEAQRKAKAEKIERLAVAHLRYAKELLAYIGLSTDDENQKRAKGKERLHLIIKEFPDTEAAKQAKEILEKLKKD